jgi:TonB family protein
MKLTVGLLFMAGCLGYGQVVDREVYPVGQDVQAPKLLFRAEPKYTEAARREELQGIVLLELIVDQNGLPTEIEVLSPLGLGLDEAAVDAVRTWRFKPGMKDGKPVRVRATVETTFRLSTLGFDATTERRRSRYNAALHVLEGTDPKRREKALADIAALSKQKYPPAMFHQAMLLFQGVEIARDAPQAIKLLNRAADARHPAALYEAGLLHLNGRGVPVDIKKGNKMIQSAADLGNADAQTLLGASYDTGGNGYVRDPLRARNYLRECAVASRLECRVRLGKLLLESSDRTEPDLLEAIAWLEIAESAGSREAVDMLQTERQKLSPEQRDALDGVKRELLEKR